MDGDRSYWECQHTGRWYYVVDGVDVAYVVCRRNGDWMASVRAERDRPDAQFQRVGVWFSELIPLPHVQTLQEAQAATVALYQVMS